MHIKIQASFTTLILLLIIIDSIFFLGSLKHFLSGDRKSPQCPPDRLLRVFMYDMPWKFHIGLLDRHQRFRESGPIMASDLPPWPTNRSDIRSQHSVEYWLMASLLYDGRDVEREAVRVWDPDMADVFFVPFLSSLSLHTRRHRIIDPTMPTDRQLQVEMVEFLYQSKYWQRSEGRDHVIPVTHPQSCRVQRHLVNASILIVTDFSSYPETSLSNLRKDVVSPYVHLVESFLDDDAPNPFESRTTLLFFKGHTLRNDSREGQFRAKLAQVLAGHEDVFYEHSIVTGENVKASTQKMRSSKFCLNPLGDTPTSCRLFDAIVSHCVPVIVSDHIELPFEDELDYIEFSIFFSQEEALQPNYMVNRLRQFPRARWVEMWRRLKDISHHFEFQYPPKKEDAVNMIWRQVKHKLPRVQHATHRSHRLKMKSPKPKDLR